VTSIGEFIHFVPSLDERIHILAKARRIEQELRDEIAQLEAALADTPEGRRLAEIKARDLPRATQYTEMCDDSVRTDALRLYEQTGQKKVHPEVQIKEITTMEYDPAAALEYARQHLVQAIKLDKVTFEKVAKVAPPAFVTVHKEAAPYITRDLSRWLNWTYSEPEQPQAEEQAEPVAEAVPF
jgi:hypothetical protein